jgi:hypothetical protein
MFIGLGLARFVKCDEANMSTDGARDIRRGSLEFRVLFRFFFEDSAFQDVRNVAGSFTPVERRRGAGLSWCSQPNGSAVLCCKPVSPILVAMC